MKNKDYIHKEFPKTQDSKDFWGQIKRTINGKPVGEDQIGMIVDSINLNLNFQKEDVLLDIGCGNGALTQFFYSKLKKTIGIDFSEYLITIAKQNFEIESTNEYFVSEGYDFIRDYSEKSQISKILCYGVFCYFNKDLVKKILVELYNNYSNLEIIYIGNIADRERASNFFYKHIDYSQLLDDSQSSIGIWWTKNDILNLCNLIGWNCEFIDLPSDFYCSHYRFDVLLKRLKFN